MSKFEWTELERLSNEIAHAQSRFDAARATKNYGLSKLLQQEITDLASRRAQVLATITRRLGVAAPARRKSSPAPLQSSASGQTQGSQETQSDQDKQVLLSSDEPPGPKANKITKEGDALMWDELTRADIERFKRELAVRRSELLARHTEELKALDAEQTEIDAIEQAIELFARKFKLASGAEVVPFAAQIAAHSQAV